MTEEEKAVEIEKATKKHREAIEARKKQEIKDGFLDPFGQETNYVEFLKEIEKSKGTIAEYCKGKISADELAWLEKDIEIFNNKKTK